MLLQCDKKSIAIILLLLALSASFMYIALTRAPSCAGCNAKVEFVFSPDAQGEVTGFIRSAQETIDIEMYVFTSKDMIRELAEAEKRGVQVRVLLEPRIEDKRKQETFDLLSKSGVDVRWASFAYKLTHSKFIIVDGKRALVGSINFSESALNSNREAAAIVEGAMVSELVNLFGEDWGMAAEVT